MLTSCTTCCFELIQQHITITNSLPYLILVSSLPLLLMPHFSCPTQKSTHCVVRTSTAASDIPQSTLKSLLADSDNDTSSASNHCSDPCPELTKRRLHTMGSKVGLCIPAQSVTTSRAWCCTQDEPVERTVCRRFWWRCRVQQ